MAASDPASGQGIERIAAILRVLADHQVDGARLADVGEATGLSKSTVHRMLTNLVQQGLVEQEAATNRFYLSFEMFSLGAAAANRFGLLELAHGHLMALERRCSDTIYLSMRVGGEAICIDRVEGGFPIKVLTLSVGDRRPLGVGAGSLALLAALPDDEADEVIEANRQLLSRYPSFDSVRLWTTIHATRQLGYAFNEGQIIPEMCAVGVPVLNSDRQPVAALSIAATAGRMEPERRSVLVDWLRTEAEGLQTKIAQIKSLGKLTSSRQSRRLGSATG